MVMEADCGVQHSYLVLGLPPGQKRKRVSVRQGGGLFEGVQSRRYVCSVACLRRFSQLNY